MFNYSRNGNSKFAIVNDLESNHSGAGMFEMESNGSGGAGIEVESNGSGNAGIEVESNGTGSPTLTLEENYSFMPEMESNAYGDSILHLRQCGVRPLPLKRNKEKTAEWERCNEEAKQMLKEKKLSKIELRGAKGEAIRSGADVDKSLSKSLDPTTQLPTPPSEQGTDWSTYALYGGAALAVLAVLFFAFKPQAAAKMAA